MEGSEQRRSMGVPVAEPDSPAGERSAAPSHPPSDTPWQWASVRERATTTAPVRVLPSAIGAELVAALRPLEVPRPAPGAEGVAVRRERRTTWGLRVAGAAFVTLAGVGLLATDIGAGIREEVLAQLPDLLVPGSGGGPLEPAAGPAGPGTDSAPLDPQASPVVPGTLLTPSPVPLEPTAPVVGPVGPVTPVDPPGPTPTPPPPPAPPPGPTPVPPRGNVSALLDPVLGGAADVAGGATGGLTGPVTGAVLPVADAVTDLLDGVVDPVVGLLGDLPRGR